MVLCFLKQQFIYQQNTLNEEDKIILKKNILNKPFYALEITGVKGKPDIIDIIEKKRLQWYGHVKRMPEERISKSIMEWIPCERKKKRGRPRKT
jgi:hypothetical protein